MPTRDDVEALKRHWMNDPCYDLEDAEGFEDYRDELMTWRAHYEADREQVEFDRLYEKAAALGVSGNTALARYVMSLEQRLARIESRLTELDGLL